MLKGRIIQVVMKRFIKGIFICSASLALLSGFFSCDKNNNGDADLPLVFESLTIEHDTIPIGGTTQITAKASGNRLTFYWTVTEGAILGSGEKVTYTTNPCEPGEHTITCRVEDSRKNYESKSVKVFVEF
jgi:hypothetical protein